MIVVSKGKEYNTEIFAHRFILARHMAGLSRSQVVAMFKNTPNAQQIMEEIETNMTCDGEGSTRYMHAKLLSGWYGCSYKWLAWGACNQLDETEKEALTKLRQPHQNKLRCLFEMLPR